MLSLSCVEKQIINWLSYCGVFRVWYSLFFVLFSENSKSVFCVTLENEKKKIVEVREQIKFGFVSYQIRHTEMYLAILASVLFFVYANTNINAVVVVGHQVSFTKPKSYLRKKKTLKGSV